MKYAEFNIETNKIEFFNSVFGIESILLNGKRVSRKFSFSGASHDIPLGSKEYSLESSSRWRGEGDIKLELKEEREVVEAGVVKIDKKQRMYWIIMGVPLGMGAYNLLNLLLERLG